MFEGLGYYCNEHKTIVKSNNPIGYNKYNKNKDKKIFEPAIITQQDVQEAYRELWKAKREMLSKAQKFARINKIFCGLDKVDQEFKLIGKK